MLPAKAITNHKFKRTINYLPEGKSEFSKDMNAIKNINTNKENVVVQSLSHVQLMASDPITSWQIDRGTMETVTDFIFSGSKITADGDFSHEIKRCLHLRRKAMTNLDNILKSKDITLLTKVHLVKAIVFSSSHVWM